MKVLCVLADVPVMRQMEETMQQAARLLKDAEVVYGDWLDGKEAEFSNLVLMLENKGPNHFPLPRIIEENLDAEIVIGAFCPFSKEMMERMPNLKAICIARGGVENVDLDTAGKLGIAVVNAAGRNANAVSDFTVGMMLCEARNIARSHYAMKSGRPDTKLPHADRIPDMEGKTVGLVGYGHIGQLTAKKLGGFDVNIIVYDPFLTEEMLKDSPVSLVTKEALFRKADFISVHARLTDDTFHLIGRDEIALMKKTAYFINTARAGLVDYEALYDALSDDKIAGAALDVFYEEPLPADSRWTKLGNVTLTGHMAGATADAQKKSPFIAVKKLLEYEKTGNKQLLIN